MPVILYVLSFCYFGREWPHVLVDTFSPMTWRHCAELEYCTDKPLVFPVFLSLLLWPCGSIKFTRIPERDILGMER